MVVDCHAESLLHDVVSHDVAVEMFEDLLRGRRDPRGHRRGLTLHDGGHPDTKLALGLAIAVSPESPGNLISVSLCEIGTF